MSPDTDRSAKRLRRSGERARKVARLFARAGRVSVENYDQDLDCLSVAIGREGKYGHMRRPEPSSVTNANSRFPADPPRSL